MKPSPELWKRITAAFEKAVALDPELLKVFLQKMENEDPPVHLELLSLLSSHQSAGSRFLEDPVGPKAAQSLLQSTKPSFAIGETVGDFLILRPLGAGTFATVYLARQLSLGREVALKVSSNLGEEARTMASLEHDNIVSVFSETVDTQKNIRMICMQFVPGCTLERLLLSFPEGTALTGENLLKNVETLCDSPAAFNPAALKDRETLLKLDAASAISWLGIQIADALAHAHQKGILHLDIKPGNILISPYGRPMLTDFNISINRQTSQAMEPKLLGGTANYMAPEHQHAFDNKDREAFGKIDARSDLFSLGIVLRDIFLKTYPPNSAKPQAVAIRRIIEKCTASLPENRFISAAELSRTLAASFENETVRLALPNTGKFTAATFRHPILALISMIVIPQIIAAGVNIIYNASQIVSRLTLSQQDLFSFVCLVWNPLVFGVSFCILVRGILPLYRFAKSPEKYIAEGTESLRKVRKKILAFPILVITLAAAGWIMAMLIFPITLRTFRGPLDTWVYQHFAISFILSGLIAVTYSFIMTELIGIRVLYPMACEGIPNVRQTAREELVGISRRVRLFRFLAGFIPLMGALLLIFASPEKMDTKTYDTYRILLTLLIVNGMAGFLFALRASDLLSRTIYALTGVDHREN